MKTYIIRNEQNGPLPNLDEYDIDVEAATARYVIFQATEEQVSRLSRDWTVEVCPAGQYSDDTEGSIRVTSSGAIDYLVGQS